MKPGDLGKALERAKSLLKFTRILEFLSPCRRFSDIITANVCSS